MEDEQEARPSSPELDWSWVEDSARARFVSSIRDDEARRSASLDGITRLAARVTGMRCAQISLIGSSQFVPSSYGCTLEEDQENSPLSESLCSVTMAYGQTLLIDDTRSHAWVRNLPPVRADAVGSYLGVPLRDPAGRPIGALCAFDAAAGTADAGSSAALEDLASLVTRELYLLTALETSAASEIRLRKVVTEIADRPALVGAAGLQARARYLVPDGAPGGGDWIDFTRTGDDRVAFSIGDVAGHGLDAIVVMDELRHALRAYSVDALDPAEALHRADRLLAMLRPESMATALHGDYDASSRTLRLASAGHPPPVLLSGGDAIFVDVDPSPPLGFDWALPELASVPFVPGDRLVLVTDGVFERRTEPLDAGLARLLASVAAIGTTCSAGAAADRVLAELLDGDPDDDACILVIDNLGG